MNTGAIIVAAGQGTRMGGVEKCALLLQGRTILSYSVAAFAATVDAVVVVVAPDRVAAWRQIATEEEWPAIQAIVPGGATRQASVRAGFDALCVASPVTTVVAIHDGARPLITPDLIGACLNAVREQDAAILAVPVTDTIKQVEDGRIIATPERAMLWAAQTPQAFRVALLRDAFAWAASRNATGYTDEAGLVEAYGASVAVVRGNRSNLKVTEPDDRIIAAALLAARNGRSND